MDHRSHEHHPSGASHQQPEQVHQPPRQDAADDVSARLDAVALHGHPELEQSEHQHHDHQDHAGHGGAHAAHNEAAFARLFWIALALSIPVIVYSELLQDLFGYTAPAFPGSSWLAPLLASGIYWYTGWIFLRGAVEELRVRQPGMMTLVALAITSGYLYSLAVTFGLLGGMPFYWELASLVTIMLLGHWLEMRAVGSAKSALQALAKLLPDTAERIGEGGVEQVLVDDLRPDDLVLVRPGGQVPADGTVEQGRSQVDESMITGESRPVGKTPGDAVIGGTVNGSGSLRVRVGQTGADTVLSGIMRLVEEAQTSRTRAQALADRSAYWLTIAAVVAAAIALVGWSLARGFGEYAVERAVTTLVVACPHALGLAIPLVIAISTTLSARNGILVRDRMALERARLLDVVVFDKTGTLTEGRQGVVEIATADGLSRDQALALAAAVEGDSEHSIATAIRSSARERGVAVPTAERFAALPGRGVQAVVGGQSWEVGGPRLLEQSGLVAPDALSASTGQWGERGETVIYLLDGHQVRAAFGLADVVRPESREAIAALKGMGVRVAMLTGDSADVARAVAAELGIDEYFAEVLPEHKSAKIKELQRGGARVAMVGDGVNDAPALAQADVGIAIGAGTDVALASAGIVLIKNDPSDVARIIRLSRATYRKMLQNLGWAAGYNVVALPLAAGALAGIGLVLPVWVGAVLMSLSTVIVAINAQTLRRLELGRAD